MYKKSIEDENLRFNVSFRQTDEDFKLIDFIVEETFAMYTTNNVHLLIEREQPGYKRITDEQMMDMIRDVTTMVLGRISPVYLERLSMIYNANAIDETIYYKVKLTVMDFVSKHN